MRETAIERAIMLGQHIIETKNTVRKTASLFGVSKSSVHKDVTERLQKINPVLHREVGNILKQNKEERHLRGGEATKQKYQKLKRNEK